MRIVFPIEDDQGMESSVFDHFGSARLFMIIDTDAGTVKTIRNQDADHAHGQCQPLKALGPGAVDAVVAGGIGIGALHKIRHAGIKIYRGIEGSVQENLELLKRGILPDFAPDQTCPGHGPNGECAHGRTEDERW